VAFLYPEGESPILALLTSPSDPNNESGLKRWLAFLYAVPVAGTIAIVLYAVAVSPFMRVFSLGLLIAGSAWITGGFFGFLFGIPRSAGDAAAGANSTGSYRSNTNLEQISDWLTKILVGLGLVEFGRVVGATSRFLDFVKPALGDGAQGSIFALSLILLFAISGFLALYIVTRAYLGLLFARTEVSLTNLAKDIDQTQALAVQVDEQTRAADPEPDSGGDDGPHLDQQLAAADPASAPALGRARVVEAILNLHQVLYGNRVDDVHAAIARLHTDGYLDDTLSELALRILNITRSTAEAALTPEQATSVIDSVERFLKSLGRTASIAFETRVEQVLGGLPSATIERRPATIADHRAPDFLITAGDKRIVVEAYLPQRPRRDLLQTRIKSRLSLVELANAAGLLVVVPDGVDAGIVAEPPPRVLVLTLNELRARIADNSLLDDPGLAPPTS